MYKKLNI